MKSITCTLYGAIGAPTYNCYNISPEKLMIEDACQMRLLRAGLCAMHARRDECVLNVGDSWVLGVSPKTQEALQSRYLAVLGAVHILRNHLLTNRLDPLPLHVVIS